MSPVSYYAVGVLYFYRVKHRVIKIQLIILLIGVLLMGIKALAWYLTQSNALLTDALESLVNITAGAFTLYSLILSYKPKDLDHPYGHGKVEFIAAGVEGSLIGVAGILMIIKAAGDFYHTPVVERLDWGILLATVSGIINYIMGLVLVRTGRRDRSLAMISGGKHLQSDGYTSAGMILGLIVVFLSEVYWLDNVIAIILGLLLVFTCIRIVRKSIGGIMDETDLEIVNEVIIVLKENRRDRWIDIHNLRVIKYGPSLHIDCHVTLPWYLNLREAHDEMDSILQVVEKKINAKVEFFIHNDPCLPESCKLCRIKNCQVRKHEFVKDVEWNTENLLANRKHEVR